MNVRVSDGVTVPEALATPASPRAGSALSRLDFWGTGVQLAVFGVFPLLLVALVVHTTVSGHIFAVDFVNGPWDAGKNVIAGVSPYVSPNSALVTHSEPFVYPAVAAILLAPFSLIAHGPAAAIFTAAGIASALLTLRVLEVRDWRVYGIALMWPPVISGWQTANVTLLLGLGVALVWRHRGRAVVVGALVALLISAKLFLWPLGLWLLATRRYVALGYAVLIGLAINLVAWGVLGFDQIGRYWHLMQALTRFQERRGFSVLAMALHHGLGRTAAYGLSLGIAAIAGTACLAIGRRGHTQASFALCVATCLLVTPIIWLHYFALLLVPLAIARPRLSAIWLAPLILQFGPATPGSLQIVVTLAVAVAITAAAMSRPGARGPRLASIAAEAGAV
jgi:glycosyl transferase family 87